MWTLLAGTRLGIAMRAVVDDRNLARLNGENPDVASTVSWVVGCMLAALAGILLAPILALDVARLTLLVISAYAVAVVGRLRSLPLTALGAVILGLALSYFDWGLGKMQHVPVWVQSVHDSLPIIMLFVVLLVAPAGPDPAHGRCCTRAARRLCRRCARRCSAASRSWSARGSSRRSCTARSCERRVRASRSRSSCCRSCC